MAGKKRKLKFRRQQASQLKRLGEGWRRPKGLDSKMRLGKKGKPSTPSVGYRKLRATRGTSPSGLGEVLVNNPKDVKGVDPGQQAVRISARVGRRKREEILKVTKKRGIKVLNPGGVKRGAKHAEKTGG
jgi:large subunit ribosomal protein L32e